jgi:hypothetical protein
MKRLVSTSLAFLLMALAGALFGMGSQGALYAGAENLISLMSAWQKECAGKTDADCSRNLTALRKQAFETAKFADELATEQLDGDSTPDGKNGWRAHWRMYAQLFKYHGECFNHYDTPECRAEWVAQDKERTRLWRLYGPEPRWRDFPDPLRHRVFTPDKKKARQ